MHYHRIGGSNNIKQNDFVQVIWKMFIILALVGCLIIGVSFLVAVGIAIF